MAAKINCAKKFVECSALRAIINFIISYFITSLQYLFRKISAFFPIKFFATVFFRKIFAFFEKFSHSFFQNNFAFYVNQIKARNIAFFASEQNAKFLQNDLSFSLEILHYIYRCIPRKHACIQYIHSMQFPIQVLLLLPSQLGLINCIKIKVKYATT